MGFEVISYTFDGDTLSMSPSVIDIDELANHKRDTFKGWLKAARDNWDQAIGQRFAYYLDQPPKENIEPHHKVYCPDNAVEFARKCVSKNKWTKFPICGLVYVSTRYQISCHELLFGVRRPVELFGRTRSFLALISSVRDDNYKAKIHECLKQGFLDTDSPMYVLKERCMEAGFSQGMSYHAICSMVLGSTAQQKILDQIYAPNLPHRLEQQTEDVAAHSPGFNMVIRDCRKYHVSADYLVLQDYSDYAVMNGRTLTDVQKEWLSLYLCASPTAQTAAISMLTKYMLNTAVQREAERTTQP